MGAAPNGGASDPRLDAFQLPIQDMLSSPTPRTRELPDGAHLARSLHVRAGVGIAAHVLQGRDLEILRMRVDQPAMILVDRGIKAIRTARGASVRAVPGQAVTLGGNQTVDFTNSVPDGTHYEARWLLFDDALLADAHYLSLASQVEPPGKTPASAQLLRRVPANLADAFDRAGHALALGEQLPDAVVRLRVLEVMQWLLEEGIVLRSSPVHPSASVKLRALIAGRLDEAWPAGRVAGDMALSEATLRRRLAAEGTSLTDLLADARMATALTLLQATTQSVSQIALSVGYGSQSRFAVRFRHRFGFAPTAVRSHDRAS
jgi:AraC-like DNA-binding protein